MDIPDSGAIFTLGKSYLIENQQSYFFVKNDPVKKLISGLNQGAVVCESGRLFVWGENQFGQLGIGTSTSSTTATLTKPTCVKALKATGEKVLDVTFGVGWSVVLTSKNALYFSGRNIFPKDTPAYKNFQVEEIAGEEHQITKLHFRLEEFDGILEDGKEDFYELSSGNEHFMVLTTSGRIFGYGSNQDNQLGVFGNDQVLPVEFKVESSVRKVTCGPKSTLILTNEDDLFLAGQLNEHQFPKFTKLVQNFPSTKIIDMQISQSNEVYLVTWDGDIYKSQVMVRTGSLIFQKFYDYPNEENGTVVKLMKGNSFYAALTKSKKLFTTFSESGHHLKTFREISKLKSLKILDFSVGDEHILILGVPKSSRVGEGTARDVKSGVTTSSLDTNGNLKELSNVKDLLNGNDVTNKNEPEMNGEKENQVPSRNSSATSKKSVASIKSKKSIKEEKIETTAEDAGKGTENPPSRQDSGTSQKETPLNGHKSPTLSDPDLQNRNEKVEEEKGSVEKSSSAASLSKTDNEEINTNIPESDGISIKSAKSTSSKVSEKDSLKNVASAKSTRSVKTPSKAEVGNEKIENDTKDVPAGEKDDLMSVDSLIGSTNINTSKASTPVGSIHSKRDDSAKNQVSPISIKTTATGNESSAKSESHEKQSPVKNVELLSMPSPTKESPVKSIQRNDSTKSIKFDSKSIQSEKSAERIPRPQTPFPNHSVIDTPNQLVPPSSGNSLETNGMLESVISSDDVGSEMKKINTQGEELMENMANPLPRTLPALREPPGLSTQQLVNDPQDEDKLEVEFEMDDDTSETTVNVIRFINDGVDVTDRVDDSDDIQVQNYADELLEETDELTHKEEVVNKEAIQKDSTLSTSNIKIGSLPPVMESPPRKSDDSKEQTKEFIEKEIASTEGNEKKQGDKEEKTVQNPIEDDEGTTASVNSNNTGNPFENENEEGEKEQESLTEINVDVEPANEDDKPENDEKTKRTRVKRFISDLKTKGREISCRNNNSIQVEDEPPAYSQQEATDQKTSKVCTIL